MTPSPQPPADEPTAGVSPAMRAYMAGEIEAEEYFRRMTTPPPVGPAPERVPDEAWWVLEPIPGYVRVTVPKESLVMPVDQVRRFASQLVMAADATAPAPCPAKEGVMGRADEVEALWNAYIHDKHIPMPVLDALREYAQLLRRSESDVRFGVGEWSERDTRPRFDGGARSQEDGEDRCAPLVEFAEYVARVWQGAHLGDSARAALDAHRERTGDG